MATQHNFRIKNGLEVAGTERISSAGAFTGSLASATTATTQSATDNSTKIATTAYTDAAITAVIGGAPGTLDTLNELAAAINDDASYASTLTTALATKFPLAGGTVTGNTTFNTLVGVNKAINSSVGLSIGADATATNSYGLEVCNSTSNTRFLVDGVGSSFFYKSNNAIGIKFDASTGNVGIGETNPDAPLHITSNTPIISFDESDAGQEYRIGSFGGAFALYDSTDSAYRLIVDSSGKVGIGTTSPANILHVHQSDASSNAYVHITQQDGGSAATDGLSIGIEDGGVNAVIRNRENGYLRMYTNNTERMRITSAGDVLIGQTSQTGYVFAQKLVVGDGDNNDGITIQSGSTHQGNLAFNHSDGTTAHGRISYQHNSNYMQFFTNNTERMRIDSAGKTIIKTSGSGDDIRFFVETQNTSDTGLAIGRNGTNNLKTGLRSSSNGSSSIFQIKLSLGESEGTQSISSPQFQFYHNGNFTATGSVSSDRRLKENIVDIPDGSTALIKSLNPVSFNLIGSSVDKAGFIAQEVETVKSSLVNGGEIDEQGAEIMRGVDYYGILAHAVKTIQELEARITELEG